MGINLQALQDNKGIIFTQHLLLLKINYLDKLIIPIYLSLIGVVLVFCASFIFQLHHSLSSCCSPSSHDNCEDIPEFHKA